jgi:ABC-type uncharacterized transport system auxiliary subunit
MKLVTLTFVSLVTAACGGKLPQTRYYQLAAPPVASAPDAAGAAIAIDPLVADGAYDDERIVYRTGAVRLDYYDYHRWSTAPGAMIGAYLEQALGASGRFHAVARDTTKDTAVVLGGRVTAIEELDDGKTHWSGHLGVELTLTDPRTGEIVWSHAYDERVPLDAQSPEGLARGLSKAMADVVRQAAPVIGDLAEHTAEAHGAATPPVARADVDATSASRAGSRAP